MIPILTINLYIFAMQIKYKTSPRLKNLSLA